jgi:hypothetical protein
LFGLIRRIEDLGLVLLEVESFQPDPPDHAVPADTP